MRAASTLILLLHFLVAGSQAQMPHENQPRPDINAVLRAHDREWLRLPSVVGVAVGLLPDGKTQCLKILLAHPEPQTEHALPKTIEGYPILIEITGEIRPLQ